jgi:hypothetical protein
MFQQDGLGAGLQRELMLSPGEEGTAQANQCGCRAAGGAFPKLRDVVNSRLATCLPEESVPSAREQNVILLPVGRVC